MIQIDAKKLLDEKLTAEQLFLYLREHMEDPSADIYEDGYKNVVGFIACDIHGNIVSTYTEGRTPLKFNATQQAIIKHIQATANKSRLADNRHELAEVWKEKAEVFETNFQHLKIWFFCLLGMLIFFLYHYHMNLQELNMLKSTIDKPAVIQYTDSLTQK